MLWARWRLVAVLMLAAIAAAGILLAFRTRVARLTAQPQRRWRRPHMIPVPAPVKLFPRIRVASAPLAKAQLQRWMRTAGLLQPQRDLFNNSTIAVPPLCGEEESPPISVLSGVPQPRATNPWRASGQSLIRGECAVSVPVNTLLCVLLVTFETHNRSV